MQVHQLEIALAIVGIDVDGFCQTPFLDQGREDPSGKADEDESAKDQIAFPPGHLVARYPTLGLLQNPHSLLRELHLGSYPGAIDSVSLVRTSCGGTSGDSEYHDASA